MSLDNLVKDIENFINSGVKPAQDNAHNVNVSYAKWFKERKQREPKTLFFSEIGKPCQRALWYNVNKPELAEKLPANATLKFFYGDILEELVLGLAEDSGYKVEKKQERVEYSLSNGWKVAGRIDAVINNVLVDVKSTTKLGQAKFDNGLKDDPFGYKAQLSGYATALGLKEAGFLTIQKELGHIKYYPIRVDIQTFEKDAQKAVKTVQTPLEELPRLDAVPQSATSPNMKLGTTCSYCSFKQDCWKDANEGKGLRMFTYSGKVEFLVDVKKQPKVEEIARQDCLVIL